MKKLPQLLRPLRGRIRRPKKEIAKKAPKVVQSTRKFNVQSYPEANPQGPLGSRGKWVGGSRRIS
jgi:hypothetical protein